MSDIYNNPEVKISSGTVQFIPNIIEGTCEYCTLYTYNGFNLLGKVLCEQCRIKLLRRIDLIMKFE